jgi:pimeloyl-ACP methyl ester carboxylesterase
MSHSWEANSKIWCYAKRQLSDGLRPTADDRFRVIVWNLLKLRKSSKAKNNDHSIEKYARDLEAVVATLTMFRLDETQRLATINVPILIMCGASDIANKLVVSDRMKAEIPYS